MRSRLAPVVLASMLVACSTGRDAGGVPIAEDAAFMVTESSGQARQVEDLDALLTLVPFEVVLPASVPEGVALRRAQLTLPDPRFESLAPYARARATPVLLSFSGGPASGFAVSQTEAAGGNPATMGDEGVVAIDLPGAAGAQLLELPTGSGRAQSATIVIWQACAIDFELTAPGPDVMPREEVLALARAFIEGCQSREAEH